MSGEIMKSTEKELKQEIKILELQKQILELQLEIEKMGGYKYIPYVPYTPPVIEPYRKWDWMPGIGYPPLTTCDTSDFKFNTDYWTAEVTFTEEL